jgi:hypothetical protein
MARTAAGSRSGVDEYELHGHLSEKLFRAVGGYVANFSSSVSRISQEIYSQPAVYLSYTLRVFALLCCTLLYSHLPLFKRCCFTIFYALEFA